MFKDIANTLGILLILPDVHDAEIQAKMLMDPIDAIKKLSERYHDQNCYCLSITSIDM